MLSRCLVTKFLHRSSSRKFTKGALLVGYKVQEDGRGVHPQVEVLPRAGGEGVGHARLASVGPAPAGSAEGAVKPSGTPRGADRGEGANRR